MNLDAAQLAAFSAVIREGSFDAAANALFVTPSAVSQRIKLLEERCGRILIQRGSPCTPTPAGEALYRYALQVALLEGEALAALALEPQGKRPLPISIAVNADSLATWIAPALTETQRSQQVCFDLQIEDQDHAHELLRSGRVMGAISTDASPAQGCESVALGAMRYVAVASPAFFETYFASGISAETLAHAPCNTFNRKDSLQREFLRTLGYARLNPPKHFIPSTHGFVEAALAGLGWGMNPQSLVEKHIERGTLKTLCADAFLDVPLYWQCWRLESAPLKALTDAIVRAAHAQLIAKPQSSAPLTPKRPRAIKNSIGRTDNR
ncbi:MAG: LysR family transcriptional regulator ArgP [Betaproteobacteria bacterium]|nr:MAG: LysR family transcriptional regulator ArgP [Betaproteobacteria bacterium]